MKVEIRFDQILCSDSFQYRQSCHYEILTIVFLLLRLFCNHTLHFFMFPLPFAFHLSLFSSFSASFPPLTSFTQFASLSLTLSFTLSASPSLSLTHSFFLVSHSISFSLPYLGISPHLICQPLSLHQPLTGIRPLLLNISQIQRIGL